MDHSRRTDLNSSRKVADSALAGSWLQSVTVLLAAVLDYLLEESVLTSWA